MKSNIAARAHRVPIPTSDGEFTALYSNRGLCGLEFPSGVQQRRTSDGAALRAAPIRRWHTITTQALKIALAGQRPRRLPPIDLSGGSKFQQRVWRALRRIAAGRTWSYSQVARAVGNPKAARAVGAACGANPIPVFVPCHRVLAAHNGLGGFSGGLNWKRTLLTREGIRLPR